jgi:acyl-CoA synthetase (NDP forming)
VTAAERIGYPLALKGMSPQLLHKTDVGIVRLNLKNREEVVVAYREIVEKIKAQPGALCEGVLVQEMVQSGTEIMVGISQDPQFGPTVAFGLGGIFVEALGDIVLKIAPVSRRDALAMISGIKGTRVLQGIRGRPPVDREALVDLIMRVSRIATDHESQLRELDLNPVIVFGQGLGLKVVDALAVLK